jgi:hypothetical protein
VHDPDDTLFHPVAIGKTDIKEGFEAYFGLALDSLFKFGREDMK